MVENFSLPTYTAVILQVNLYYLQEKNKQYV